MTTPSRAAAWKARRAWWKITDPDRLRELAGERVVFAKLRAARRLEGIEGRRILEIGPKHGGDSRLLAKLGPAELVLIDLPEKRDLVASWLGQLQQLGQVSYMEGNVLHLSEAEREALGRFDLVWCTGVLYHQVEQYRLLKRLYDFCAIGGRLVLESATTRSRGLRNLNIVEVHWPRTYRNVQTITHLPSQRAIASWLEMVGFSDVERFDAYSRDIGRQRAVFLARRHDRSLPYVAYSTSGLNPPYVAGDAS